MRQKTALMRALVHEPDLLLLDEPTAGLDITSARAVRTLIQSLVEEGRGVVWSTHDLSAATLCDRLVLVHNAKVVANGPLSTLLASSSVADAEALHELHTMEATREFLEGVDVVS
jgi:sodium transport system ATP-binding protein